MSARPKPHIRQWRDRIDHEIFVKSEQYERGDYYDDVEDLATIARKRRGDNFVPLVTLLVAGLLEDDEPFEDYVINVRDIPIGGDWPDICAGGAWIVWPEHENEKHERENPKPKRSAGRFGRR